ncbi:GDYXXLXY domain-containing protein [Piscinibacter gummiphilus]|uniref:GDYXXLXY domain-containing protein n=1 Tax=Piscinibacter gummiphilus TaxID=946333 RepID=A0ABZ0CZC4_9BURK|nr:GDYXXLXY domain-containing protein [Piscinibacter gummiphilus]WOB08385.1 GDYXXLXY domain-containing protein [Piscinibacter gummiphilus]
MHDALDETVARARAERLLPEGAARPGGEQRPWPVVLLTALGAWLAALPLLGVVGLLLGPILNNPVGPYFVGVLLLVGSAVVLRSAQVPLFIEQLAVPGVLVGGGALGFGLYQHLPHAAASLAMAAVAIGLALGLRQAWLQALLGVAAASLVGLSLVEPRGWFRWHSAELMWTVCHLLLAIACTAPWWPGVWRRRGAALESLLSGWWLTVLVGLAALAGMTFLVGGVMGGGLAGEVAREVGATAGRGPGVMQVLRGASAVLALLAVAWVWRAWRGARHPALVAVAVCAAALSFFMATLGGALFALAVLLVERRWRLAALAGVAAAWIVGAFYYALAWDLATKALVLVAVGAVVGAVVWWLRAPREPAAEVARAPLGRHAWYVGGATAITLLVAASAIWQKQELIARGQPVFVALAPVDPRSLMQGDYMRLNFIVPVALLDAPPSATAERPKVVARRDARGVAALHRVARPGEVLGPDEFLFELTPKGGGWILVSDAWFFREGEAELWAKARFGEFRVMPDGRALLVGMADETLRPIKSVKE